MGEMFLPEVGEFIGSPLVCVWNSNLWGSNPINTEESVPSEDEFTEVPSVFPHDGGLQPSVTCCLHHSAVQLFLACSSAVFVEPSQWEVGRSYIPRSPADWSEHFICSGTDIWLAKHSRISVYFRCARLCFDVYVSLPVTSTTWQCVMYV